MKCTALRELGTSLVDCSNVAEWLVNGVDLCCSDCIATYLFDHRPNTVEPLQLFEKQVASLTQLILARSSRLRPETSLTHRQRIVRSIAENFERHVPRDGGAGCSGDCPRPRRSCQRARSGIDRRRTSASSTKKQCAALE
jgi:hypothetical protein